MKKKKSTSRAKHFNPEEFHRLLGERCRALRNQKELSVNELSRKGQLSPSLVIRLENGTGSVTAATLCRFAAVLKVPVKDLFDFRYKIGSSH